MAATQLVNPALVLGLDAVNATSLALVGGKAANLGELIAAGLPVPPGFVVSTEAYRLIVDTTELHALYAELAATSPSDTTALAEHARRARELLTGAHMPESVAREVSSAYRAFSDGADGPTGSGSDVPVAVRSSATAEDLPTASFAGQHDTHLNVVGERAVLDAVQKCWASLWTDRAVSYRAVNGIDHAAVALAVVVQRMVDVAVAGVLFTADPVTGRRHQAVVDASPGLGEAVVSGAVNPDRFILDTQTGEIVERRLGDKRLTIRAVPGGGTEQVVAPPDPESASIGDAQLRELTALGERVERHYGVPQDIEWALDEAGGLWLTQARPITTLFPLPPARAIRPTHRRCGCISA